MHGELKATDRGPDVLFSPQLSHPICTQFQGKRSVWILPTSPMTPAFGIDFTAFPLNSLDFKDSYFQATLLWCFVAFGLRSQSSSWACLFKFCLSPHVAHRV